ncbi:MAG: competence protein ComEC [Candidatus Azotimanducaceae bacterium]|jgi:competence protein ComEC
MNILIIAFLAGVLGVNHLTVLPLPGVLSGSLVWILVGLGFRSARILAVCCLGAVFALGHLEGALNARWPSSANGETVVIVGTILSLPASGEGVSRFRLLIEDCLRCPSPTPTTRLVRLSRRGDEVFKPGQRWRLAVRLYRPRGLVNPGLFDYQQWLLAAGVDATGYILTAEYLGQGMRAWHHQGRAWLREQLYRIQQGSPVDGLLVALGLGENSQISRDQWRVLSATGTNHLLIISGLHVSLVAGLGLRAMQSLAQVLPVMRLLVIPFALSLALGYGLIAGMGMPVQRALVMFACASLLLLLRRQVAWLDLWMLALLVVVVTNPLASYTPGYYLSFGAVAMLLYGFGGRRRVVRQPPSQQWLVTLLRSQWLVGVGMTPLLLLLVAQCSGLSLIANLVAIPVISLLIVPLLLLTLIALLWSPVLASVPLSLAAPIMSALWQYLESLAALDWVYYAGPPSVWQAVLAVSGVLVILQPAGCLPRWPGMFLCLPLLFNAAPPLAAGEVEITVLDVGQGLSVVVRGARSHLLYDAGPAYSARFDAGAQIVTPYLHQQGIRQLATMVVSHEDLDHAGGVGAVMASFAVGEFLQGERAVARPMSIDCGTARRWRVDGVDFEVVATTRQVSASANNRSCVLLIEANGFRVLIPGDIEASTELALLTLAWQPVDVLIAPHHGSRSSSHPAFLNRLAPRTVVVSAGAGNRFSHPHVDVMARYRARDIRVFNTAVDGAITLRLGDMLEMTGARKSSPRFWYD